MPFYFRNNFYNARNNIHFILINTNLSVFLDENKKEIYALFFSVQLDVRICIFRYPMNTDTYNHLNTGSISMPDNLALVL
jgi:hypothetical protein